MTSSVVVRPMLASDVGGVVDLQRACFPPPFPEDLLWTGDHIAKHLEIFPAGQFVAINGSKIVASASATLLAEDVWQAHRSWDETVGGPFLGTLNPHGNTLYGLDISVHPDYRGQGVGRRLYEARFELVRSLNLRRYGTACRLPDYRAYISDRSTVTVEQYAEHIVKGFAHDRTLTPLLRYGLKFVTVIHDYMEDFESANASALLEWNP